MSKKEQDIDSIVVRCRFSGGLDPAFSGAFPPRVPSRDGLFLS